MSSRGIQSLTKINSSEHQVSTNDYFYNGTPGGVLFESLSPGSIAFQTGRYPYPFITAENEAPPANLIKFGSAFLLQQPLDALWSFNLGTAQGVGRVSLDLHFQGTIEAFGITPMQELSSQIVANLDPLFVTSFDPGIPNSEDIPHATVDAVGRGEADYFSFTVTKPDTLVTVHIADNSFYPYFEITDLYGGQPPHRRVQTGDDSSEVLFSMPGTYVLGVHVDDSGPKPIPIGAGYQLHVSNSAAVPEVSSLWSTAALLVSVFFGYLCRLR